MVTLVKHEWHSVDVRYTYELDEDILSEIYPDKDEDEISEMLVQIETGYLDIEQVIEDAVNNDVEIEWEHQYDDMWTMCKGGYDVTYELGDEDSYHSEPEPSPPTHKCTKCRWKGSRWETLTLYHREDGSVIENYGESDEDSDYTSDVCPMCDSPIELTTEGLEEEASRKALFDELEKMEDSPIPDGLAEQLLEKDKK